MSTGPILLTKLFSLNICNHAAHSLTKPTLRFTLGIVANDVGRSGHRILTVRTYFKDAYMKLSNIPSAGMKEPTLLSRVLWPDPTLDHFRSHLPGLVEKLMSSPKFKRNTKAIANMYGPDGVLKNGHSHTSLGDAESQFLPRTSSPPRALQHLMFDTDDESDVLSVDPQDEGVKDFFTSDDASDSTDNDQLAPIVISSDDSSSSSSSEEEIKGSSKRSQKNSKKRKR